MRATRPVTGFTLIELMIAVAIVAILASIAYPSYQEQVSKSRRAEAKAALMDAASRAERYRSARADASYTGFGNPGATEHGFYNVTVNVTSATTYTLTAQRQGVQAGDRCGDYTLTNTMVKGLANETTGTVATCW